MPEAVRGQTIQRIMTKKQQKQLLYWLRENGIDYTINNPSSISNLVYVQPEQRAVIPGSYLSNIAAIAQALGLHYWVEASIERGIYIALM